MKAFKRKMYLTRCTNMVWSDYQLSTHRPKLSEKTNNYQIAHYSNKGITYIMCKDQAEEFGFKLDCTKQYHILEVEISVKQSMRKKSVSRKVR